MKDTITKSLKQLLADRYLLVLCVLILVLAISFVTYIGINVRYNELQLVSHYSAFGVTHLYRDQWYYLLSFGVFGLGIGLIHIALLIKILILKDRQLSIMLAWLTMSIIVFCWMCAYSVINIWSPS